MHFYSIRKRSNRVPKMFAAEEKDYFEIIMMNNSIKITFMAVSAFYVFVFTPFAYGINWFIKNCASNRRTVINLLVASLILSFTEFSFAIQLPELIRCGLITEANSRIFLWVFVQNRVLKYMGQIRPLFAYFRPILNPTWITISKID